jgi:hypothetical protein
MNRYVILFTSILITSCTYAQETTIIAYMGGNKVVKKVIPIDTEEFHIGNIHENYLKIVGLEKLKKLKRLELLLLSSETDLSFLKQLNTLEVLIVVGFKIYDLSFLEYLPNLKILYFMDVDISDSNLDLEYNKKLQYLGFVRSYINSPEGYKDKRITNFPKGIKYLNLALTGFTIDDSFLQSLKEIPYVFFDENLYSENENLLKSYKNIKNDDQDTILPEDFKDKAIFTEIKEGFR